MMLVMMLVMMSKKMSEKSFFPPITKKGGAYCAFASAFRGSVFVFFFSLPVVKNRDPKNGKKRNS